MRLKFWNALVYDVRGTGARKLNFCTHAQESFRARAHCAALHWYDVNQVMLQLHALKRRRDMAAKLVLLLAALVYSVSAQCNTPWEDCGEPSESTWAFVTTCALFASMHVFAGSTGVTIDSVSVPGCCAAPCVIAKGSTTNFTFSFTPSEWCDNCHIHVLYMLTQKLSGVYFILCRTGLCQYDPECLWWICRDVHFYAWLYRY